MPEMACFGFYPELKVHILNYHRYSQVVTNPHTGPPNLTINVRNVRCARGLKRCVLVRKGGLHGPCDGVINLFSDPLRTVFFLSFPGIIPIMHHSPNP